MAGDLHVHTKLSNSSLGIDDLLNLTQKRGITTIAITDVDCQAGCVRAKIAGERKGIQVIPGVEFSCTDSKREKTVHLLCYLPDSPERLEGLCRRNMLASKKASQYMVLKLARKFSICPDLVVKCATGSTAVFPEHIIHALVECGYASGCSGELYAKLFDPASDENIIVRPAYSSPEDVLAAIHEAGGIAVLARPAANNDWELMEELIPLGLDGVEVWNPLQSEEDTEKLQAFAKKKGLLAIGGTDFKGMYSQVTCSVGDVLTPDADVKSLLSYKSRQKKKAAAEKAKNKEEK